MPSRGRGSHAAQLSVTSALAMLAGEPLRLLVLLAGPAAGSCAGLLADRLPRGEAVLAARSRCRECGARLGLRDLVPILSYLALGGRCRHCGAALPRHLPEAEVAGLALGAAAAFLAPDGVAAVAAALFLTCLLALALADLRFLRLPHPLTAATAAAGLALALAGAGPGAAVAALADGAAGAAAGAGSFWLLGAAYLRLRGRAGLGGGDVWLMGGIGAGLGPLALPWVALLGAAAGLALAGLRGLRRGRRPRASGRLPFGAFLAMAAAAVWMLREGGFLAGLPPPGG